MSNEDGPRGFMGYKNADQGDSEATMRRTGGIQGGQGGGPGGSGPRKHGQDG